MDATKHVAHHGPTHPHPCVAPSPFGLHGRCCGTGLLITITLVPARLWSPFAPPETVDAVIDNGREDDHGSA